MGYLDNNGVAYLYSKIKEYIAVQKPYSIAVGNGEPYSVWKGTYAEYCAITPDESTIYIITTPPYDAEIEYLQSTGTQWIDTNIVLTKNYAITIDCAVISGSSFPTVLGASEIDLWSVPIAFNNSGGPYTQVGGARSFATLYSTNKFGSKIVSYTCSGNGSEQYISDREKSVYNSISGDLSTLSMYMFARHRYDGVGNYATAKIGKVSITIGGILRRDYIPVRVGNVGYMYDKVSGKLFGNAGTGSFVLGPDK